MIWAMERPLPVPGNRDTVPRCHAGAGRVYPGFLQLASFANMTK
jgi:poly-beta-hydroxyalkanoate depolymerase